MVIHDMRNPTVAIKNSLHQLISNLGKIRELDHSHQDFQDYLLAFLENSKANTKLIEGGSLGECEEIVKTNVQKMKQYVKKLK